ncbi:MAG: flagellar hook-length control protein FliK [Ignavibacteriales bacterium]|nr:flagellar hook-length control protein FliK [Ignavibacteriales bacterium]
MVSSTNTPEKNTSNLKAKAIVENLRTSLKEFASDDVKQERVLNNKFENKNVKVDFIQRRVYSQIPHLEVMTAETEVKNVKNSVLNLESNKNEITQSVDEPVKSTQNKIEQNTKNDKQVWVKVSLEKNDSETVSEARKSPNQQNRITIDTNSDGMKKDFDQNNFSEKESHESPKQKPQVVQVEASQNTEMKTVNQNTSTQQDFTAGLKTEIKTESNPFKSAFNTEETKAGSRAAEMIEKVKVISSGEMIREISKVLETGEKQSIVLRLVPKELGSVKIILDTIDNVLTAKVEVENETVGHIVRNNVEQLKHNLMQSGVNVNSINISYHNSDQKQQGFNNQKRKNSGSLPENDIEEVDESIVSKKMGYNTYEYLA